MFSTILRTLPCQSSAPFRRWLPKFSQTRSSIRFSVSVRRLLVVPRLETQEVWTFAGSLCLTVVLSVVLREGSLPKERTEGRRGGKEGVSTGISVWSQVHEKKKNNQRESKIDEHIDQ